MKPKALRLNAAELFCAYAQGGEAAPPAPTGGAGGIIAAYRRRCAPKAPLRGALGCGFALPQTHKYTSLPKDRVLSPAYGRHTPQNVI